MGKCRLVVDCFGGRGALYRYFAMVIICLLGLGSFTCLESGGALQEVLMNVLDIKEDNFSLIYSVISWPGSILCLLGGFLIDRVFGLKWATIVFSVFVFLGHYVFSLGVTIGVFWVVLLGRFIFGIGQEIIGICLKCYIVRWFIGKELSLSTCVMVTVNRLGTAIMFEMAQPTYMGFVDKVEPKVAAGIVNFLAGISTIISLGTAIALKFLKPEKDDSTEDRNEARKSSKKEKFSILDILHFPATYWIIVFETSILTICIFTFVPFSQGYFMTLHNISPEYANRITSTFAIMGAVMSPFTGILADKIGRTVYFLLAGMLITVFSHILLLFTNASPYVGMTFLAIAFTLICASLSPMVSYVIPESKIGTAFGVSSSMVNLIFTINIIIAGQLVVRYSYFGFGLNLIVWAAVGAVLAIILCLIDKRDTGYLSMSLAQRKEFDDNKMKQDKSQVPLQA